jgi:hypothetical protein
MKASQLEKELRDHDLPEHLVEPLTMYVMFGRPTGSFLFAVLENKFVQACASADDVNINKLHEIAMAIHWVIPHNCHGSEEIVAKWLAQGGFYGRYDPADDEYEKRREEEA